MHVCIQAKRTEAVSLAPKPKNSNKIVTNDDVDEIFSCEAGY